MSVSIVCPVYNVAPHLDRCISSLLNQTYRDIEILLVNDGSTDESLEICRKYAGEDDRILLQSGENHGVSVARNSALEHVRGDWVCFVDGDDYLPEDAVEKMLKCVEADTDILITDFSVDKDSHITHQSFLKGEDRDFVSPEERLELIRNCFLKTSIAERSCITAIGVPWAKLYNASFLREYQITFPEEVRKMQDALFNAEAFYHASKVSFRKIDTYFYNQNVSSVTHRYNPDYEQIADTLLQEMRSFMEKYSLEEVLHPVYQARRLMFGYETIKFRHILNENKETHKEIVRDVRKILEPLSFSEEDEKKMIPYLGRAYTLAYSLQKHHLYSLLYLMMNMYQNYRNSLL